MDLLLTPDAGKHGRQNDGSDNGCVYGCVLKQCYGGYDQHGEERAVRCGALQGVRDPGGDDVQGLNNV